MMKKFKESLPLYTFFNALRVNGFPLGISNYYLFLDALELDFYIDRDNGTISEQKLLKLCKILWLKPNQSGFIFESLFHSSFKERNSKELVEENKNDFNKVDNKPDGKIDNNLQEGIKKNDLKEESETSMVKFVIGQSDGEPISISKVSNLKKKFFFSDNYFELSKRQMEQSCRFLPITQASYRSVEIDIDESVQALAKNGLIFKPIFKNNRRIVNEVVVFLDNGGSMIAFEKLATIFVEALKDSFDVNQYDNKNKVRQYYFYNLPEEYAYLNKAHTEYKEIKTILNQLDKIYSMVIIISDGGAARGSNNDIRFRNTLRFILEVKKATQKIVWLNPMPKIRWNNTTAQRIARFVPMFSLTNHHELQSAMNSLKGQ